MKKPAIWTSTKARFFTLIIHTQNSNDFTLLILRTKLKNRVERKAKGKMEMF